MLEWIPKIIVPVSVFFITIFIGIIIKTILFKRLLHLSKTTKVISDTSISTVKIPVMMWFTLVAIYLALEASGVPKDMVEILGKIMFVLGVFSVTLVLANVAAKLIKVYAKRLESVLPITSLTEYIAKTIIFVIGILVILSSLGISITPILATLGIGGLAVALALQDTLANLFSGFHTIIARQIRVGDYIKLDSGEEGYVIDFNWRTTEIRMLPNNMVLVPNSKLAQAIVINYYLPDKEMAVLVEAGVHYKSDLKYVEHVVCEVGKEIMRDVSGAV